MKVQLAKEIFHKNLSIMKKVLDLGEFKLGKKSDEYKYFKKQVMDFTYKSLQKLFKHFADEKIIVKCNCKSKFRPQ
jgi:hypothetical protein